MLGFGLTRALDLSRYSSSSCASALFAIGAQALHAARRSAARTARRARATRRRSAASARALPRALASHTRGGRTSVLMGLLHGGAGSAAVLALLPLARFDSGVASALYLVCFCLGVAVGALAFARVFASLAQPHGGRRRAARAPRFKPASASSPSRAARLLLYEFAPWRRLRAKRAAPHVARRADAEASRPRHAAPSSRERRHEGPFCIQRPFYPGDGACHVYLLHPPGGLAAGDELDLDVDVGAERRRRC